VALDFLTLDSGFEKSGITNVQLPAPLSASEGWAIGAWIRLKASLIDATERNTINQLLQMAPTTNGAVGVANTVNIWWAAQNNLVTIDGTEPVTGKIYATVSGWVAGNNTNAGAWSDVGFSGDNIDRLLILQLVNVAGSWKLRLYVTAKGGSATLVNESPTVVPANIVIDHIRIGNRIPAASNRDWRDIAGQLFLIKRPLAIAEITSLASGTTTIASVAAAPDLLGYWPLEAAGTPQNDLSGKGNNLTQLATAATYAGFDFVSGGSAALVTASTYHSQSVQNASLTVSRNLAVASGSHIHSAQNTSLGLLATSIARPSPHGDVDLLLSSISAATSASPLVTLFGDPEGNQNIPNSWHNLCARIENVQSKTPQFTIANVHQWRNGAAAGLGLPQRGWRPWWRVAGGASTSWQRFDSYSISGNAINFSNAAAFAVANIEVAFFPVWNLDETNALFDAIFASGVGSEPPKAVSYRSTRPALPLGTHNETAAVVSPDGIAVPVLPMRSARISSATALSPEGLPKRKAILLFNMHAQEASGGWVADRLIRALISNDADAIWLRSRFIFDCYAVNNSGMFGGASRGVVEGWNGTIDLTDANRSWSSQTSSPNGPSPEVNDIVTAIAQDSNSKADVLISHHSDALTSVNFGLAYYFSGWDSLPAVKAYKDALLAAPAVATLSAVSDNMAETSPGLYREQGFGRHVLGAALSWVQENTFATSDYLADSQAVATRQISALRQLTETGLLPAPMAVAPTLHSHQSQSSLTSVFGTLGPQRAVHGHGAQSPSLSTISQINISQSRHSHSSQSIILASGIIIAPARAVHTHGTTLVTLIAAGQISLQTARHSHNSTISLLSVPTTNKPRGRNRSITNERRTLKLRFS
jgi:hypothetical protein